MDTSTETEHLRERWQTSLHETGHATIAAARGLVVFDAEIRAGGWGLVQHGRRWPVDAALIAAGGPLAARMFADATRPTEAPLPAPELPATAPGESPTHTRFSTASDNRASIVESDEAIIARFCIREPIGDPELWAQRYEALHSQAAEILNRHRDFALDFARELYRRGVLSKGEISIIIAAHGMREA